MTSEGEGCGERMLSARVAAWRLERFEVGELADRRRKGMVGRNAWVLGNVFRPVDGTMGMGDDTALQVILGVGDLSQPGEELTRQKEGSCEVRVGNVKVPRDAVMADDKVYDAWVKVTGTVTVCQADRILPSERMGKGQIADVEDEGRQLWRVKFWEPGQQGMGTGGEWGLFWGTRGGLMRLAGDEYGPGIGVGEEEEQREKGLQGKQESETSPGDGVEEQAGRRGGEAARGR